MENAEKTNTGRAGQRHLFNTGGPRSRVRTEKISSCIFDGKEGRAHHEIHAVTIPQGVSDLVEWVRTLYKPKVFVEWEKVLDELELPAVRLLVVPVDMLSVPKRPSKRQILRSAVILSKCSNNYYSPDSPMIFTRNRLDKKVELIKIDLNSYYGMD